MAVIQGGLVIESAIQRGQVARPPGVEYYVDTVNGSNNNSGLSWEQAKATMAATLALIAKDNATVYVVGDIREQITAPLGIQGVRIIGMAGGRTRHDDGVRWREASTAAGAPLLTLREQGWELQNILFVPQSGYSALRAHRAETASYPDSSHFIVRRCKFIGGGGIGTPQGIGIEDWGGNHHYLVEECEFHDLVSGIVAPAGSPGIAAPLRNTIRQNVFEGNQNDVCMDGNLCRVLDNLFMTAYHVTAHPNTVNLAYVSDVSGKNSVIGNFFADATANVVIAKGYKPSTGDRWRNYVSDAADPVVAVPS